MPNPSLLTPARIEGRI